MTQLSPNFSLEELTRSRTAERLGLNNSPPPALLENLKATAEAMEAVRKLLGQPIRVSSGYRGPALNAAVKGAATSAHCFGYAIDFTSPAFGSPFEVCRAIAASGLEFDQLIHEYGSWTHIAFDPRRRRDLLTIASAKQGYKRGILPI